MSWAQLARGLFNTQPVQGTRTSEGHDLTDIINEVSGQYNLPPQVLLALGLAESGLTGNAARERAWPDVSYGPWQQTVAYAPIGDRTNTAANRAQVRNTLTTDYRQAADMAAQQIARDYHNTGGSWQEAFARYNGGPAMTWDRLMREHPGHARNYEQGWSRSQQYLAPPNLPMMDLPELPNLPLPSLYNLGYSR